MAMHGSFTPRQNQELAELLRRQQNEMQALLTKSSMGCVPLPGDNVMLEVDGHLVGGVVEDGSHFDGSIDVITEKGERHVYCQLDRVQLLRRGRSDSIPSSDGLTMSRRSSGASFFSSRRGSDMAGLSRRSSESALSRKSSSSAMGSTTRPPLPCRKPNAPLAHELIEKLNSFSLSSSAADHDSNDDSGEGDEM
eukprot:TRINITY_DN17874_c0_g1_i1.p1 TRINITY_DN17874_c0_g1~~TRINITY_DN17874_c0_g1_i1.p1  ORF type:complete len:194 (+),score=26.15 TRINITY_DN17874_c0_g1_i1:162-743(+)